MTAGKELKKYLSRIYTGNTFEISGKVMAGKKNIVFNWHNFLSGCSAWDFAEWNEWIDRSSQMRFNTIMVHAYGNNPMFTFRFNGKQKRTGLLSLSFGHTTTMVLTWGGHTRRSEICRIS